MEKFPKSHLVFMKMSNSLPTLNGFIGDLIGYTGVIDYTSQHIQKISKLPLILCGNKPDTILHVKYHISQQILRREGCWGDIESPFKTICELMLTEPSRFEVLKEVKCNMRPYYRVRDLQTNTNLTDVLLFNHLGIFTNELFYEVSSEVHKFNNRVTKENDKKLQQIARRNLTDKLENIYGKD